MGHRRAREGRDHHSRRPAVHAHVGDGRHVGTAARRERHRVPRRDGELRAHARPRVPRLRRRLHQRRHDHRRRLRWPRGSRWSLLGLGRDRPTVLHTVLGLREGRGSRSNASAPTLGLSDPDAPLRALHAGNGGRSVRRAGGLVPAHRQRLLPRVGTGAHRCHLLRRRPHAAFGRGADHPDRSDSAAAARQHRASRRRHPRAARPCVDSRLDRHPDALRHPAGLPADAVVRRERCHARRLCQHTSIARGVVGKLRQVRHLAAQGVVRRPGDNRERVRLRLAAPHQRGSLALRLLARHGRRPADERARSTHESPRGPVRDGTESGRRRAQRPARTPRPRQPRLAGRAGHGRDRDSDVLARFS